MWRTPDGDRALMPGEWALFLEGLVLLWDRVRDEPDEPTPTGVGVFDRDRRDEVRV